MPPVELKLKQASAVLGIPPKDLQNLVQFGVVKPPCRRHVYWFDRNLLLQAKVAFYLKESLGVPAKLLARVTRAWLGRNRRPLAEVASTLRFLSRPPGGSEAVEIRVPLRSLAREIEEQLPRAMAHGDLPRGRKRSGWKEALLQRIQTAAGDLGDVSDAEILQAVRMQRPRKRDLPEITILVGPQKKTPPGRH